MPFKVLQSTRCRFLAAVISLGGSAVLQPVLSAGDHPKRSAVTSRKQGASRPLLQERPIRVETALVSLGVTVMDNRGRAVEGLEEKDFLIYEDGIAQQISFFSHEERPVSWGLVLDRSGSMRDMIEDVYKAALHSIEAGTPEDESFIVTFNQDVELTQDFTSDRRKLRESIRDLRAGGSTALYDAVAFSLKKIEDGRHQKKALMVVTDGEDNVSRTSFSEVLDMAKEAEALIFTIGFFESRGMMPFRLLGGGARKELERLSDETGGIAYFPKNMEACERACRDIAHQVSRQYSLAYYPGNTVRTGKWREIKVTLRQSKGFRVRARKGYFAGTQAVKE